MRKVSYIFLKLCRSRVLLALILGALIMAVFLVKNVRHLPYTYQSSLVFLPLNIDPMVRMNAECLKEFEQMRLSFQAEEQKLSQSPVIAYASVGTNSAHKPEYNWVPQLKFREVTITEIWKGSRVASRLGITNGMKMEWPDWPRGELSTDGAVLYWGADGSGRSLVLVNNGRIYLSSLPKGIPLQEYRRKCGT